jgi:hypothetical protein
LSCSLWPLSWLTWSSVLITPKIKLDPPPPFHTPNSSYSLVPPKKKSSPGVDCSVVFVEAPVSAAVWLIVMAIVVVVDVFLSPSQKIVIVVVL